MYLFQRGCSAHQLTQSHQSFRMDIQRLEPFILKQLKENLSPKLHYHNLNHTISVMKSADTIAKEEGVSEEEQAIIHTAALLHDVGFIWDFDHHEAVGSTHAREILPEYGYTPDQVDEIAEMILATKVPQSPKSPLAEILCDADLAYLGSHYIRTISNLLYLEFKERGIVSEDREWQSLQIDFLTNHHFHTEYAQRTFQEKKEQYLNDLRTEN